MSLFLDLRFALRSLIRNPGFALTSIGTLGVGIGVVTAMFSIVDGVLLHPLPVRDQDRLVLLTKTTKGDDSVVPFAYADLEALRERARILDGVAGVQYDGSWPYAVRAGDQIVQVRTALVSGGFFRTLGVPPEAGRTLRSEDTAPGADRAAVISHDLWERRYGADPDVVGKRLETVEPKGTAVVVGVASEDFEYPQGTEMWLALPRAPRLMESRFAPFSLVGRLTDGGTPEQAASEVQGFLRRREATVYGPDEPRGQRVMATKLFEAVVGDLRPALLVLSIAVLLLLLLVGSNVANLLLVRTASKGSELAVRSAIGARRGTSAAPLLLEGLSISLAGALVGAFLAWGTVELLVGLAPPEIPRLANVSVRPQALGVALVAAVACAALSIVAPVLWIVRSDLHRLLRLGAGGGSQTKSVRRGNQLLVVLQAAVAMVVVAGAGLLGNTLWNLQRAELGFAADELLMANVALPRARFRTPAEHRRYYERLGERLEGLPGVDSVTPVMTPPFSGEGGWNVQFAVEGQTAAESSRNPTLNVEAAAPGHFETLGTTILRGRGFTAADREGSIPVAVVSEALASKMWPGQNPIGKRLRLKPTEASRPWREIVGVAQDSRYRDLSAVRPSVYVPLRQSDYVPRRLLVRVPGEADEALGLASTLRRLAREVDGEAQLVELASVPRMMEEPLARPRFNLLLMSLFSFVALVLAAVGLYGITLSWVVQRSRELALRMVLGARAKDIRRMVFRRGLGLVGVGIVLGLVLVLAGGRLLSSLLFGVRATDPATLGLGVAVMLLMALLSCYRPVRRAVGLDPAAVLSESATDAATRTANRRGR